MDPIATSAPMPGAKQLFGAGWALLRNNGTKIIPILIVPAVCTIVARLLNATGNPAVMIVGVVFVIASYVFSIVTTASVIQAIDALSKDPAAKVTVVGQYKFGFSIFWSLLLVSIINIFVSIGAAALFIIPIIFVSLYSSMHMYKVVLEGKRGYAAFTESYKAVSGRAGAVFGCFFVFGILVGLVGLVGFLISMGINLLVTGHGTSTGFLGQIENLVISAVTTTIGLGGVYALYTWLTASKIPDVSADIYKKWLIAFTCIGAAAAIAAIVFGIGSLGSQ